MKNPLRLLVEWWPLTLLIVFLLLSLLGGGSSEPRGEQSYEDWKYEMQQDAEQSYQEQYYRGY